MTEHKTIDREVLEKRFTERDMLIRKLWLVLHDISYMENAAENMTDEDLNLWTRITEHSAVQNNLSNAQGE